MVRHCVSGRCVGSSDCELLFAIEIPSQRCLAVRLIRKSERGWERRGLSSLVRASLTPDYLLTEMSELLPILDRFGACFETVATAHLDKAVTLMPAINQCLQALVLLLNEPSFQRISVTKKRNEALEEWRIKYNEEKKDCYC